MRESRFIYSLAAQPAACLLRRGQQQIVFVLDSIISSDCESLLRRGACGVVVTAGEAQRTYWSIMHCLGLAAVWR